jgi:cytochrome c peroxidase
MNKSYFIIIFLLAGLILSCTQDKMPQLIELDQELETLVRKSAATGMLDYYILPDSDDLENIPQDLEKNPLSPQKVELGMFLFHETGFAMNALKTPGRGTYSCASCHIAEAGFRPGSFQGIGDGGKGFGINGEDRVRDPNYIESELDVQSARPLSMTNVAYVKNTFWNGQFGSKGVNIGTEAVWDLDEGTARNHLGYEAIETQNIEGVETHRLLYTEELIDQYGYRELFDASFPEFPEEERYSNLVASLALSAYIRTILTTEAPFQKWLKGDRNAMSFEEKEGAILFFSKANCSNCHYRPNLGSLEFHALGVTDMDQIPSYNTKPSDKRNKGRGGFTLKEEDNYKFKVPQLYNMSDAPFYFHGASKRNLDELLDYKIKAQTENPRVSQDLISEKFLPLDLNDEEKEYLKIFLEKSLRDPNLVRYKPEALKSGFCFPNNDLQSRIDLGCN